MSPEQWVLRFLGRLERPHLLSSMLVHEVEFVKEGAAHLSKALADRDRLQTELDATRKELEGARFANGVLDSAAKDAQAWAYQLQECKAELARVKRNHLRRMEAVVYRFLWSSDKSWVSRTSARKRRLYRLYNAIRASFAQLQSKDQNP